MGWSQLMQLLPFLERKRMVGGVWQPPPGRDLTERVGPPLGDHSPLTYLSPALPREPFEDEEGGSLVREREFGPKLWRKDLEEPLSPFQLGPPMTLATLSLAL